MNAIARSFICSLALSSAAIGSVSAQNPRTGSILPRRAQLTVERAIPEATSPLSFRCEWGNGKVVGPGGVLPVNVSGFLGAGAGADYAMYGEAFTVPDGGGVLSFYTSAGVMMTPKARSQGAVATGSDIVVGQMIDLIDAESGELLRGIRGTFLRFNSSSAPSDSSWSYQLRIDLSKFTGRRVRLRSLVSVVTGSESCKSCPASPLPAYITYFSDAPELPPTVVRSAPGEGAIAPLTEPVTTGEAFRPILK